MLRINRWLTLLLLVMLILSACQPIQLPAMQSTTAVPTAKERMPASLAEPHSPRPDAPTYGVRGPYAVGVRDFVIEGTQEYSRSITVSVWYPASNPSGDPEEITYQMDITPGGDYPPVPIYGHALQDAAPLADGAPFPLVLYSHGAWSFRQSAAYLMEQLASYGFTVIAPDHVDNWGTLFQPTHAAEILRPIELRRALDYAEALTAKGGWLEGLIDMEHVAAAGWSFGGEEAMILGGARFNLDEFFAGCAEMDNVFAGCEYTDVVNEITQIAGLEALPTGLWPDWSDPRVDVVVALAPGSEIFGKTGTQMMDRPILLMVGSLDDSVGPGLRYFDTYEQLRAAHKSLVTIENASHIIFFNACAANPGIVDEGLYWACSDPVWDMNRAHDLINHFVTAFLLAELKGDADASKALAAENVNFPGIQYETTAYVTTNDIAPAAVLDEETIAKIEAMIEETMATGQVPGAAVGVIKDGALVYAKGFGVTSLNGGEAVTPESVFTMASVAKSVVALALMQLVEEGKIDLDAPVTEYLPYFTLTDADMAAVTIRRLLSHTAGMPDTIDWMAEYQDENKRTDDAAMEDYVRSLSNEALLSQPGTEWAYSNIAFVVLGDVIAKVSGQSFEDYIQAHVLQPLGMENSSFLLNDIDAARLTTPHLYGEDGKAKALDFFPYSRTYAPAGSFYSSVNDMARFVIANMNSGELEGTRVLPASAYAEMWAIQATTTWAEAFGPQVTNSGLGWFVGEYEGHRLIGNYGVEIGFQSHLGIFADEGYGVVALVNFYDPQTGAFYAYEIGNGIATILLEAAPQTTLEAEPFVALSEGEFTSVALADNLLGDPSTRRYAIYLPPSYAVGERRYPVVYVLHGFTGNQWSMLDFQEKMDAMIQNGDVPEMIVVMPDASNTYLGSFYMNSPTIGDYETYITSELVAWIDAHYRTLPQPQARGITGCSMGGLGAVRLGLQHPQVYGVVAGVSGPYVQAYHRMLERALAKIEDIPQSMTEMSAQPFEVQAIFALAAAAAPNPSSPPFYLEMPFVEVDGEIQAVAEVIERFGVVYANATVADYPGADTSPQAILLYHGDQDPMADVEGVRLISTMLTEQGVDHTYLEVNGGGHCNLDYEPVIRFMAEHLYVEPAE